MSSRPQCCAPPLPWSGVFRIASRIALYRDWAHRTPGNRRLASGCRASHSSAATRCTDRCRGRLAWSDPLARSTLPGAAQQNPPATQRPPPAGRPARSRLPAWCAPRCSLTAPRPSAPGCGACARSRCTPPRNPLITGSNLVTAIVARQGERCAGFRALAWPGPDGSRVIRRGWTCEKSRRVVLRGPDGRYLCPFRLTPRDGHGECARRLRPTHRGGPGRRHCRRPRPTDG